MILRDLTEAAIISELLRRVDGRWALVSKSNPTKVLQYYHGSKKRKPSLDWIANAEKRVNRHKHKNVMEGGNVFKDKESGEALTQRINQADVLPTVKWLEQLTGLSLIPNLLGTTGKKETSGDLDIGLETEVDKNSLITKLAAWATQNSIDPKMAIKKTGVSVHFYTPIRGDAKNGFVQTDFMFVPNLEFAKFTMAADAKSKYKDFHKHVVLSSVAKHHGFKWSPTIGLISRTTDKLISTDTNEIAKMLLGSNASSKDITSVESVLAIVKKDPNSDAILADAVKTLEAQGIKI